LHIFAGTNRSKMPASRKFDSRQYLENHFPSFFLLLGGNTLDWKMVNKRFVQTFEKYLARYERTNTSFCIETSLFNIIDQAGKHDPEAIRNFEYLQTLFTRLTLITDPEEKKELCYHPAYSLDRRYRIACIVAKCIL
jgi:hypothetical protein